MVNIMGIQILGIFFAVFMLYYTFLQMKRKEFTAREYSFWMVLWVMFLTVTVFPGLLDPVVESLNIARTMDFFIILGFMFLVGAVFYTYALVRKTQKRVEEIVRRLAIKNGDKKEKII